jgi:hypothetical protein
MTMEGRKTTGTQITTGSFTTYVFLAWIVTFWSSPGLLLVLLLPASATGHRPSAFPLNPFL